MTITAFAFLMSIMALGVMLQDERLAGSCGANPDSGHCGCSPEKKAACRKEHASTEPEDGVDGIFSGRPVTKETLAPPCEERLIQLRARRE